MADITFDKFVDGFVDFSKNLFSKFAELSVAQTVLLLEQAQASGKLTQPLTQVDIQAFSQYTMIENAKMASNRMLELANKEGNEVKAAEYRKLANNYDALANVHQNELNKLAGYKLNTTIFDGLDKMLLVDNITQFIVDFINQSYTDGLADAIASHYDEAAKLVDDVLIFKTTIPNWVDSLIAKIGLNPKSLSGIAMKGFGLNFLFTVEYYAVEWFFREIVFEKLGLYENETYISLSDKIFGSLDSIKIGTTEFDAVSSVYALLQANARNTLDETQWARLFGSDEVRKMNMEMVRDVLKESIKIIAGKEIAVDTPEQMIKAVQENYGAFKKARGFDLIVIDNLNLVNNLKHDRELYDAFYQQNDLGIAYRYALKNLNNFVIASNEKVSIDYSQHNQNGELDLWSVDNQNGMTMEYIKDRLAMLYFNQEKQKGEMLGDWDGRVDTVLNGDAFYIDDEKGWTIDVDGFNPSDFATRYVHFGSSGDDKLTGDHWDDKLYGGLYNLVMN